MNDISHRADISRGRGKRGCFIKRWGVKFGCDFGYMINEEKNLMRQVPKEILDLIETFERNIDSYKGQEYNEAQLRREFIDPFFESLGWDVTNKQQFAPAYRDVIHEDAIKVGTATKAPDYCFRIGGFRKFFLEAKKPSIDVRGDPHPSYQLRRYAWSAKLPLSILTNFEEFAVYDCQSRPSESDSSSAGRIMFINYKDYPDNWEKIAGIFSKEAVLKGSFDKFTISTKTKKGTTTVDIAFLAEIENWRQTFAKTIAHRNLKLTVEQINYAVQKTVDRILFLRMCEDRGIEPYKQLLSFINGDNVYPRLCSLFEKADAKYNSGLFHFKKNPTVPSRRMSFHWSLQLTIKTSNTLSILFTIRNALTNFPSCRRKF